MKEEATSHADINSVFIVHFILVIIAWVGPFVFPWYLMVLGYGIVVGQFLYYKRCLMNQAHGLDDSQEHTFYSHLFERLGFKPNRNKLKNFIRSYLYIILAIFTLILQLGMSFQPYLS
ncbi:MAG: hypothetical protein ACI8P3_002122 [Saprospiraceae bacterium]|jgi:hypothetical protein